MPTIHKVIDIDATADAAWAKLSDTPNIASLISFMETSEQDDDVRVCSIEGGGKLVEKIVEIDQDLKRVAYSITESPLSMEYHAASMQIVPNSRKCQFVWTTDVQPAAVVDHFGPMIERACGDMQKTLA